MKITRSLGYRLETLGNNLKKRWLKKHLNACGFKNINKVDTFTTWNELETLFKLAESLPQKSNVVEIGSYLGASTCFLAAGLESKKGKIICIDTWKNETMPNGIRDTYKKFCNNTLPAKVKIIKIRKKSTLINKNELPKKIHLAFIDGDHSYRIVKNDFNKIKDLIAKDGIVAFHDIIAFDGVAKAVGEILKDRKWKAFKLVENLFCIKKTFCEN